MVTNNVDRTVALKSLQVQLRKTKEELQEKRFIKKENDEKINQLKKRVESINLDINSLSEVEVVVSEHALLRYFERVMGYNLDEIKDKILNDEIKEQMELLGKNGTFPNKEGFKLKVKKGVVVTII